MPDISGWEFMTLAVLAVVIFGPDRLPKLAADAGRLIRTMRQYVHGAKQDLARELGPEFSDLNLSDLNPRGLVKRTLGGDDFFDDLRADVDLRKDFDLRGEIDLRKSVLRDSGPSGGSRPLEPGEAAPYDPDAT
jgi:sec-independent protein translocase protein TatB